MLNANIFQLIIKPMPEIVWYAQKKIMEKWFNIQFVMTKCMLSSCGICEEKENEVSTLFMQAL